MKILSSPLTSDIIRSCTKKNGSYAAGNLPLIEAASVSGRKRIFVACPATNTGLTKVIMPSSMNADCTKDFVKKSTNTGNQTDPFLKKVASITLSPGKSVQVITLHDHCFVLGVSDSNVQLISELDDKDLINAMNLEADKEPTGTVRDFATMLASAMGIKKKTFEESVTSSVETMQNQSNRLKNISLSEKKDEE